MSNAHALHVLKVAVAQICQTIGWHSAHSTTMELLVDVTQHFLREISRIMHRYTELYNRTEPNLDDLAMAYKDMGINLQEVMEYIQFVDPIPLALEVRRFPIPRDSQLSFMKPGSKEVLTRPVHIPEHMPPIFLEVENDDPGSGALVNGGKLIGDAEIYGVMKECFQSTEAAAVVATLAVVAPNMVKMDDRQQRGNAPMLTEEATMLGDAQVNAEIEIPMQTIETKDPTALAARTDHIAHSSYDNPTHNLSDEAASFNVLETETVPATASNAVAPGLEKEAVVKNIINAPLTVEGRPTREISSVIMTTSGFISPARAGKLPESCIPLIREERPTKPSSTSGAVTSSISNAVTLNAGVMLPGSPVVTAMYGDTNNPATADGVSSATQHYAAGRKTRKKPTDKQRKKSSKKGTTVASQPTGTSQPHFTGKKNNKALKSTAAPSEFADYGELAHASGALNTAAQTKGLTSAHTYLKMTVPESSLSEAQLSASTLPKASKEKTSKKRKSAKQMQSPTKRTSVQVTALFQSKTPTLQPIGLGNVQQKEKATKRRTKMSKKNLAQRVKDESSFLEAGAATPAVPPPLIGPLGLSGASAPGPLLVAPPPTFSSPSANITLAAPLGGSAPSSFSVAAQKNGSSTTIKPQISSAEPEQLYQQTQNLDHAGQLNLLQMMHPSLEITATPTISRTPGSSRKSSKTKSMHSKVLISSSKDRDVIVIDDDRSLSHSPTLLTSHSSTGDYGGEKKQRKPPISSSDLSVAYGDGTEYSVPGEITATSQQKYIDYSPPKTSSAVPKTPEIKLHSSPSPSTSSWIGDAGHIAPGKSKGNLFAELSSPLTSVPLVGVVPEGSVPIQSATGKKQKRPKHKPTKHGEGKRFKEQQQSAPMQQPPPVSNVQQPRNPFAMFPGPNVPGSSRPYPDPSSYGKYLNQSLQAVAGMRPPMPFGIFPLPSGPGLIPDTPLFSTAFGTHPGAPGFPMPPNHFGLSAMNRFNEMNLLRMTRPIIGRGPPMGGAGHLQPELYDEPLDPETKLAQTPLDLQKSTCNVAPLMPPSLQLFPSTNSTDACSGADDESLNLSTNQKPITASMTSKSEPSAAQREPLVRDIPRGGEYEMQSKADVITTPQSSRAHKEDQVVILPAASVLPGASPPQRSKMLVIDIEDSDGSQSTATTSKDGKRKSKEHKKDRKLKEGKLKKKKDKKDKSKNREREREQLEEQAAGTSTSSGMMTMGMIGAEEALQVQLRKERKEKKEKRKDKAKKEKRKERERLLVTTDVGGSCSGPLTSQSASVLTSSGTSSASVPKLMLKIGGSIATASPQPDIHEKGYLLAEHGHSATATLAAMLGDEANRDGSPELARISALVTRPPKLKISCGSVGISSGKNRKEESLAKPTSGVTLIPAGDGAKLALQNMDESDDSLPTLGTTKHLSGTTNSSTSGSITSPVASSSGDGNAPSRSSSIGVSMGCATNPPNRSKSNQRLHPLGVGELTHSKGASLITEGSKKVHKESKVSKVFATTHNQQQTVTATSASSAPAQMTDVDGNTVWICPACGRVDDGTPMIGCDGCDAWYHWVCVGILVPPEDNEDWYCRVCIAKKQDPQVDERQRKRKKKDKKTTKD